MKNFEWIEEDRGEFVEQIVDGMIAEMTYETLRQCVWDLLYEDLIYQEWPDLWSHAEKYAPELVQEYEEFG